MSRKMLYIAALLCANMTFAQSISIGITIRSIHTSKPKTAKKYNNWNPGIFIQSKTKDNVTFTTGVLLNSWKKLSWISGVGYQQGDWEFQLGCATGYKHLYDTWVIPGYFVNYHGQEVIIRMNHKVINFGKRLAEF